MTFMDSLAQNPNMRGGASNSGVYGMPESLNDQDALSLVNKLKDREMTDFKDKANFMSDLSLRQEQRMRQLYDPNKAMDIKDVNPIPLQRYGDDISPIQREGMSLDKSSIDAQKSLEQTKLHQGQEAIDIKSQQEKLNQQKSDQINTLKQADMQRKIEESNQKIELAQQKLQQASDDAQAKLEAHKAMAAAVEERHKLEMEKQQHQFDMKLEQQQRQFEETSKLHKDAMNTKTTTEIDPSGNKKTVTSQKGDAATTVDVLGKDGKTYTIPKDKLNDMDADGTPHWKQIGGGEE